MKKKVFLSFADKKMWRSAKRIKKQALRLKVYDEIIVADESFLDVQFVKKFKNVLNGETRGFGYWIWKPQLILQTLNQMNDGDLLQYTDVGCHLNAGGKDRLIQYFKYVDESKEGVIGFQAKIPEYPLDYDGRKLLDLEDYKWTKGDLLDYFKVRNKSEVIETPTVVATVIFLRKCESTVDLINSWIKTFENSFELIDDSPSISDNLEGFVEHRHDQAIFSILCKIKGVQTISAYEHWYPSIDPKYPDWSKLKKFPIHARRDKDLGFRNSICISKTNLIKYPTKKIICMLGLNLYLSKFIGLCRQAKRWIHGE